ncbi:MULTISPECIES: hypothetical protein [Eubacteriales]|uniref:hypothetical protein n=1 Tax=Eubacteriales TaxID=186802 RepID=UPI000B37C336|nr:hypothetical protein [Anaeromassilibacillus sp. An200]OUP06416.1 hypothetical protein B5F35_15390 [Anaeromassilibacillus sp. An200]
MWDLLGLCLIIAVFAFIFCYNGWLKEHYGVSAFTPGRMIVGTVDTFIWILLFDADSVWEALPGIAVAGIILLLLLGVNYQQVKNRRQAVIMTLWHLVCGLAIIMVWYECGRNRKKRK